ncbi:hypothetical protein AMTRI_Chr13g84220 [Amborella trichopoda]
MAVNEKLSKYDDAEKIDESIYQSLVGSLIYLTNTVLDIMHAVSICSRFMNEPRKLHFAAAKRIFRYIQRIKKHGIKYIYENNTNLVGFSDSDWACSIDDRKITSGYIFCLGTKQNTIALSSAEVEYISAISAACEAVWLKRILSNLPQKQNTPIAIFNDNMSAISMTKNPVFHSRSKHIEIRHHFIRELTEKGEVEPKFINTNNQLADIFTMTISTEKFIEFRYLMSDKLRGDVERVICHRLIPSPPLIPFLELSHGPSPFYVTPPIKGNHAQILGVHCYFVADE